MRHRRPSVNQPNPASRQLQIPMAPGVDSLNVGVAVPTMQEVDVSSRLERFGGDMVGCDRAWDFRVRVWARLRPDS